MSVRGVALGLAVLLLAGCAAGSTKPSRGARAAGHGSTATPPPPASGLAGAPRDNIHLSQSERYRQRADGQPRGPHVDISKLSEPVPTVEPRSRYGNKSPYTVRGKTYHVLPTAKGYEERGMASWYGNKFHGYMTSDFEKYDMYKFSAASKTLPLPSWVRVTNLKNGKSVIVRVNDRGPFVANRIIDLSYAAAVRIGIWPHGTGLVEVRAIDPAHPRELSPPAAVPVAAGRTHIWLQVGAFGDRANAARVVARLRRAGLGPVEVTTIQVNGRDVRRVRLGPLDGVHAADSLSAKVVRIGLPKPRVAVD